MSSICNMAQTLSTEEGEGKVKSLPKTIIKSSGTSEPFDLKKLEFAINQSLGSCKDSEELGRIILATVLERIEKKNTTSTHYINDIIETYLLKNKHYEILQKYIGNRFEKNRIHSEKVNLLGTRLVTDPDYPKDELQDFSVNQIQIAANRYLQRDMGTGDITESMTGWFDRVASHVVLGSVVYDPSVYSKDEVPITKQKYDLEEIGRDPRLSFKPTQLQVLRSLYKKIENNCKFDYLGFLHVVETCLGTDKYQSLYRKYFQYMYQGIFEPNTPTLMNAGTANGKCSACFTLAVFDNMHSIMGTNSSSAYIFQGAGGLGVNISYIRPRGANIGTTFGAATGPIELVLEIIDFITQKVKSGGKRRGANMGLMEYWHPDIMEFINMKKKPGYLENFNVSVMFDEDFWKHYHAGTDYDLKFGDKVYGKMSAANLIENIAVSAWSSAEPGVAFKDNANKANPLRTIKGDINICNPCAEQFMYDGESCTLGSINLAKLVREDGTFDWDQYVNIIHETTRFLNDVLEINQYPTEHIAEESDKSKRIGLGIMGLADLFFLLKIPYNSQEGFWMMEELSKTLYIESVKTSIDLAEERGSCYWYDQLYEKTEAIQSVIRNYNTQNEIEDALGKKYLEKLVLNGIRNMWTTTIAPTGTISMIADCSSGLEPIFSLVFSKLTTAGKYYYTSELFKKALIDAGIYSQELLEKVEKNYGSCQGIDEIPKDIQNVFLTAMDLHWMDHVVAQSVWQNWIDNSISKCVAKGTLVQTNKGVMKIEDIGYARGQDVFAETFDPELKVRDLDGNWKKVTKHYSGGKKRTVKVRLNNGNELEGTFIHRVMTDNGWKTLGQVEIGDLVAVRKSDYNENREGGMKLPNLSGYQNERYLTRYNKMNSLTHMTPQLAKILGMIVADGSINESTGHIGIVANNDVVKQTFIDLVKQVFNVEVRVMKDKRRVGLESLSITSRPLARMYRGMIGHNARNKHVPTQILQGSKAEQKAFLEGLTLDGYIKKNKYQTQLVVYEGLSKQLRDEVASILYQNGMTCYKGQKLVNYKEQKQSYYAYNVIVNSNWIEPIEPHKQVPLKESKMMVSTKGVSSTDKYLKHVVKYNNNVSQLLLQKHGIEFDNVYFYKVTGKEDSESEVYDIEVEDTHSYLIDGVISHNTINMPYNVTVDDVKNAYILAHELGLKGIALFRDGSRNEQVLHVGSNVQSNKNEQNVQKDTPGTKTIVTAPVKNQVERKIPPSPYAMNYIRDRVHEKLMVDLTLHAGKKVVYNEQGDQCPTCKEMTMITEGGCSSCKKCGYASCSVA